MELRHAVNWASRTAPSRLWASSSHSVTLLPGPSRPLSTSARALSSVKPARELRAALASSTSRTSRAPLTSDLPPRPPPASTNTWAGFRPSTGSRAALPSTSPPSSAYSVDDNAVLTDRISWDIGEFKSRNNLKAPLPVEMHNLRASTGRSIELGGNVTDLSRAFASLEAHCRRNSIPVEARRQLFYERGGLKRKRLRSQRWRARFKEGFRATVSRVNELRRQGW